MKNIKKMMAIVLAMVMVLMYSVPVAFAADKTVTVTFNANGGSGGGNVNVTVDAEATTITVPEVTGTIPNVTAPENKSFDFWGTSEDATKATETGVATINGTAATFYAIWKDTPGNGNRTGDSQISVSGLEENDDVSFYRILVFDQDATETGGWKAAPGFDDATNGLTKVDIQRILGLDSTGKKVTITDENKDQYGINEELANKISKLANAASVNPAYSNVKALAGGTATQTPVTPGLYMATVVPSTAGVLYNPIFVGSDYDENTTNGFTVVNMEDSYSPKTMAKKQKITVDKKASTTEKSYEDGKPESVAAGDTISFTVDTTIPEFADNYESAVFKATDKVSDGLTYKNDVKVYTVTVTDGNEVETELTGSDKFTVTAKDDGKSPARLNGYEVDFKTAYLLGLDKATKIRFKYTAEVTTDAPRSINLEDNTFTINFSNSPEDSTGKGKIKDETKHYTFDIDANILGPDGDTPPGGGSTPWHTAEVVKIGVDENGKEIAQTTTLHGEWTETTDDGNVTHQEQKIGALEGAEFKLYVVDTAATSGTTSIKDSDGNSLSVVPYTNKFITADTKIVSDGTGRLTIDGQTTPGIRGLDIGTYYLLETKAPEGYIKEQNAVKIEIIAPQEFAEGKLVENDYWKTTTYKETGDDGLEYSWDVIELKKYEIKVNGAPTASYTFTNAKTTEGQNPTGSVNKGDTVVGAHGAIETVSADAQADDGKIVNKQGVELPSTGGIGTTLFYIIGLILVVGAGVLLVTKRRMKKFEQ